MNLRELVGVAEQVREGVLDVWQQRQQPRMASCVADQRQQPHASRAPYLHEILSTVGSIVGSLGPPFELMTTQTTAGVYVLTPMVRAVGAAVQMSARGS